jgi:serine/threonine-protein kinase HipA
LPDRPVVADLGCGSGASTLVLARSLQVPILAMDADGFALDDLWEAASAQSLLPWILPRTGDLAAPDLPPGSFDLIWSEGAIAHAGWRAGLRTWKELLRPGGIIAVTDATWFEAEPPEEARQAWEQWYPEIDTEPAKLQTAQALGYEVIAHFRLPRQDWWDYFEQAERQCALHAGDESMQELIAAMRHEADLYRRAGESYGYTFYILRKA